MYAVVVKVAINEPERSVEDLRQQVVGPVSQAPGFVQGYWTRQDDTGLSFVVFESEEAARPMAERVSQMAPGSVTVQEVEVREVVAHA